MGLGREEEAELGSSLILGVGGGCSEAVVARHASCIKAKDPGLVATNQLLGVSACQEGSVR